MYHHTTMVDLFSVAYSSETGVWIWKSYCGKNDGDWTVHKWEL